ncbi:MAG: UDP-N-acetylmuramoyl-tripeptide--D-alanyl-D-alanine ligase, partial [Candidatus Zixiibacteriota bacterium]
MIRLDFQTLAEKVQGKLINEQFGNDRFAGVSIDSRTIVKEQLFVAIAGSNADGHSYIDDALQKGGAGLVIAENYAGLSALPEQVPIVTVDDTHRALITLAAEYRRLVDPECIAVTGSNGKTTTKEMIYAMIRARRKKAYRSEGNLNNLYGLPLTLLAMPPGTAFGIFELGISVPGEMTQLAEIVEPDLALITNVGPTHLEMLDSVGKVAEEKFTLVDRMKSDQPVIINGDDRELIAQADMRDRKFIRYGLGEENDFIASRLGITEDGYSLVSIGGRGVTLKLFGNHQVYNMLGAYTTCQVLGIDLSADELENLTYTLAPYRGEIENVNDLTLIADCYN